MDGTTATGTANHRNRAQTQQHHLLIWQWNPNGIQGRKTSLQQYIKQSTKRPDVIILQETHSETPPTLPGYRSFAKPPSARTVGKGAGQGVCTLVKKNLTSIDHELLPNGAIEHSTVEIVTGKRKRRESTFIINVYSNPKHFQQKFRTLVHKAQQLAGSNVTLLCGDFSAQHTAWGVSIHDGEKPQSLRRNNGRSLSARARRQSGQCAQCTRKRREGSSTVLLLACKRPARIRPDLVVVFRRLRCAFRCVRALVPEHSQGPHSSQLV
ncbi:hypothetical protein MRX96_037904 [Rhipicephalus microplus]